MKKIPMCKINRNLIKTRFKLFKKFSALFSAVFCVPNSRRTESSLLTSNHVLICRDKRYERT